VRLQKGITLQELVLQKNPSKSLLSKTGNEKVWSPVSTFFTIAKALNTKISYFFNDQWSIRAG